MVPSPGAIQAPGPGMAFFTVELARLVGPSDRIEARLARGDGRYGLRIERRLSIRWTRAAVLVKVI
jgi:hypothetical protein